MMGWYAGDGGYGWMVVAMLGWGALIGLAAWAVVALTRSTDSPPADEAPTPRQIDDADRRLDAVQHRVRGSQGGHQARCASPGSGEAGGRDPGRPDDIG